MKPNQPTPGRRRAPLALVAAIAAITALIAPASAHALGFTALSTTPADTQAGANTNFAIHVGFTNPSDDVKDLRIGLPPGQIGDPTIAPTCTQAQFDGGSCPANTKVGNVTTTVAALGLLPLAVNGELYNFTPNPGEPARFAIILNPLGPLLPLGQIKLQSAVELRPGDFGLDTIINDIPNTAAGLIPIDITAMDVTLLGTNPAFSRNPTSCTQATTRFTANSYVSPGTNVTGQASYTPTGCSNLDFSPAFSGNLGAPGATARGSKTPLTTVIEQGPTEAGMSRAAVTLPSEVSPDASELFRACDLPVFFAGQCASISQIGVATAASPVLAQPLTGPVILTTGPNLPQVGLDLKGQLNLKLIGELAPDGTTTFNGLPDIPISRFALTFDGPPSGLLLAGRNLCLPPAPTFKTQFTSYSGPVLSGTTAATVNGCGPASDPKLKVKLRGANSENPRAKVKVTAGSSTVRDVVLKLPKGLRFGSKKDLKRGAKGRGADGKFGSSAFKAKGRRLTVSGPTGGSHVLRFRLASGALERRGKLRKRLRFKVTVRDVDDTRTKLTARVKK